jgi:hypothetical protein
LPWDASKKYTAIFLSAIMENKREMFDFVKDYYKYFMKGKETFPEFTLN